MLLLNSDFVERTKWHLWQYKCGTKSGICISAKLENIAFKTKHLQSRAGTSRLQNNNYIKIYEFAV